MVDPRAVDEDVDSAPALLGGGDRGVDVDRRGDVGRVRARVAAAGDDRVGDALDLGGGTSDEQDVRALVREPPRRRLADPAASPSDERPLSREPSHRPSWENVCATVRGAADERQASTVAYNRAGRPATSTSLSYRAPSFSATRIEARLFGWISEMSRSNPCSARAQSRTARAASVA